MSFTNRIRSQKGFTLIELLITVVILAILAAVVYSTLAPNKDTARASKAIAAVQDAYAQAQSYAATNGDYSGFGTSTLTGQLDKTTAQSTTALVGSAVTTTDGYPIAIISVSSTAITVCANAPKVALYCIKDDGSKTTYLRATDQTKAISVAAGGTFTDKWVN